MFFVMIFEQAIVIPPNLLHRDLKSHLKARLIEKVQGNVTEKYGYIICVINIEEPNAGKVLDTSGDVLFNIKYKAVVMKPFVGEVVDGVIEKVEKYGIHVGIGPIKVFISNSQFPPDFEYHEGNNVYVSKTRNDRLAVDSEVRFRIMGVQFEGNEFHPTGTMNENYLGPL
jgi:DNA-directed RNA polymerase II subunit RPB7